jgi:hypothetical protein
MLAAWERSGLTIAAFCRKRGILPKRLYWWRSRLAEWTKESEAAEQPGPDAEPGRHLVEAVVVTPSSAPPTPTAAVKLHLRSGDRIEVLSPACVEADWLLRLARGLCSTALEGDVR